MKPLTHLPDIAAQRSADSHGALDWVGMGGVALPVQIAGQTLSARIDAGVSLDDAEARGIHMSRLYLALKALQQPLSATLLRQVLEAFLDSHRGLSLSAYLRLHTELLIERPALVSPLAGHKGYPLQLDARLDPAGFHLQMSLRLGYSSTCPCSAALARQLIQQRFAEDFGGRQASVEDIHAWLGNPSGIVATPHSQRSEAELQVRLLPETQELPIHALLERAEAALGTALQTAVKRADEQAFALANGQNLMFCEDAARRLHQALLAEPTISGFRIQVSHAESLHAHDAVARSSHGWH